MHTLSPSRTPPAILANVRQCLTMHGDSSYSWFLRGIPNKRRHSLCNQRQWLYNLSEWLAGGNASGRWHPAQTSTESRVLKEWRIAGPLSNLRQRCILGKTMSLPSIGCTSFLPPLPAKKEHLAKSKRPPGLLDKLGTSRNLDRRQDKLGCF